MSGLILAGIAKNWKDLRDSQNQYVHFNSSIKVRIFTVCVLGI